MSTSVEQSFVKHFQADVHLAYHAWAQSFGIQYEQRTQSKARLQLFRKLEKGQLQPKHVTAKCL